MTAIRNAVAIVAAVCLTVGFTPVDAQPLSGPPAAPGVQVLDADAAGRRHRQTRSRPVSARLNFFDGFPDKATVEKLYDNLDFQRAVQAYLLAIPAVSQAANRNAIQEFGAGQHGRADLRHMDSRSIFLTANTNTLYSWAWLDLNKGPLVLEVPPKSLGAINDMWYRWVIDLGITGPDKGTGRQVPDPAARLQRRWSPEGLCLGCPVPDIQHLDPLAHLRRRRRLEALPWTM